MYNQGTGNRDMRGAHRESSRGGNRGFRRGSGTYRDREHFMEQGAYPRPDARDGRGGRGRNNANRGNRGDFRQTEKRKWPIGYKKLESMANDDSPAEIVISLSSRSSGLEERLREDGGKMGEGIIWMLLRVFGKMSECEGQFEATSHVIRLIMQYDFVNKILPHIYGLLIESHRQQSDVKERVENTLKLIRQLASVSPKSSEKTVSMAIVMIRTVVDGLGNSSLETVQLLEEVEALIKALKERPKSKKSSVNRQQALEDMHTLAPPNNFRDISVFPALSDIRGEGDAFIRVNLIGKAYQSVDHYLDVQFRLLREDFVKPLRDGIAEIMHNDLSNPKGRPVFQNVKVYTEVRIEFMKPTQRGVFHRIHFNTDKLQNIRWRNTKRLLYGNLLCLSSDLFKDRVLFAVVADRKPEELEYGSLTVEFVQEDDSDDEEEDDEEEYDLSDDELGGARPIRRRVRPRPGSMIDMNMTYTMVETDAYFEAYRHVLAGLKETQELPLERYIVRCSDLMQAPEYLRPLVAGGRVRYDISSVDANLTKSLDVLNDSSWPSAEKLKLDESQAAALKLALTNELAIIQGPPGTGKTYVGLKIMEILLANKGKWSAHTRNRFVIPPVQQGRRTNPILVVCYTNHALDQFLEGISMFVDKSKTIVRVGGRSNNEITKQFSLAEIRRNLRKNRDSGPKSAVRRKAVWELNSEMREIEYRMQQNANTLEASLRSVMKFQLLHEYIPPRLLSQFQQFEFPGQESEDFPLLYWLELEDIPGRESFSQDPAEMNVPDLNVAILMSMGYTQQQIARAHFQTGCQRVDEFLIWFDQQGQIQAQGGAAGREDATNEGGNDSEEDANFKEEADLLQEQRMLDGDELISENRARSTKEENDRQFNQVLNQMAALTFEEINVSKRSKPGDDDGWQTTKQDKRKNKRRLKKELGNTSQMTDVEERRVYDISILKVQDRWKLYRTWVNRWREKRRTIGSKEVDKFNSLVRRLQDLRKEEDAEILQGADVVAVTTTGAAKYRDLIYKLKSKIVVVEEAAEVLEAHIITAMPKTTQHLILIGDHKQLKPSPTVYELAIRYKLDTSLFERLVINKIPHVSLGLQHRMAPDIADMIRPHIYKELRDHDSVLDRKPITGIQKSLFFISHDVPEESIQDGRSKKNQHEAEFLVGLCQYILMQGYEPEQITVLTMYTGQLFAFRNVMKQKISRGIRVTAVDNFQGEENDIILLSLVRSNPEGKIGFVGIENRICVALSRAKCALYCIGNMDLLRKKSAMWSRIVGILREKECIGEQLMLQCINHPDKITPVKVAQDFNKVPEGGCGQKCETRLDCGHVCVRLCHPDDHSKTVCRRPCAKILCANQHRCTKQCSVECGECMAPVKKRITTCGHIQKVPCHLLEKEVLCETKVRVTLRCGHAGSIKCHQKEASDGFMCKEKCAEYMECGHVCQGYCNECLEGRLHVPCKDKCGRILVCGHSCISPCSSYCPPCDEICRTRCEHSRCKMKCGKPCVLCKEKCGWKCRHYECNMLCSEPCDRPPCNRSCNKKLKCDHPCIGLCGETCPSLCRICNKDKVTEVFFGDEDEPDAKFVQLQDCGHIFTYESLDRWMKNSQEEDAGIKMRECPRCKTCIRRSRRYGNIINSILNSINEVKAKIYGERLQIYRIHRQLRIEIGSARKVRDLFRSDMDMLDKSMQKPEDHSLNSLAVLETKFQRLEKLSDMRNKLLPMKLKRSKCSTTLIQALDRDMTRIHAWVGKRRTHCSEQETLSFKRETERISEALQLIDIETRFKNQTITSEATLRDTIEKTKQLLFFDMAIYNDRKALKVKVYFSRIKRQDAGLVSGMGITQTERKMICDAMGFASKGHWYKCPKGHVYCIGECGGATETSKCPECQADIGGSSHRLLESNRIATEMDGATRPAYDPLNMHIPEDLLRF